MVRADAAKSALKKQMNSYMYAIYLTNLQTKLQERFTPSEMEELIEKTNHEISSLPVFRAMH